MICIFVHEGVGWLIKLNITGMFTVRLFGKSLECALIEEMDGFFNNLLIQYKISLKDYSMESLCLIYDRLLKFYGYEDQKDFLKELRGHGGLY